MSLDVNKLQKVAGLANGAKRARCPACAEAGQDKKGEHLRIASDGKFGCCVHPGDGEHRKRIYALAGDHNWRNIQVKSKATQTGSSVRVSLGRLGRVFESPSKGLQTSERVIEVQTASNEVRTALSKSDQPLAVQMDLALEESRTPRTGVHNPRAYAEKVSVNNNMYTHKEFVGPVRGVREGERRTGTLESAEKRPTTPFFTSDGTLSIPFESPPRFHWWNGGKSIVATITEIRSQAVPQLYEK